MLLGLWDKVNQTLTIRRPSGVTYKADSRQILAGGHKVMGVETVGNEVHVLTPPRKTAEPLAGSSSATVGSTRDHSRSD